MELLEIINSESLLWNLPLRPLSPLRYALWWNGTVFLNRAIFIFVGWVIRYGWLVYRAVIWGPATMSQNEKDTWAIMGKSIKRACLCLGRLLIRKRQWRTTIVRLKNGREQALIALLLLWQHTHTHTHSHSHTHTLILCLPYRWLTCSHSSQRFVSPAAFCQMFVDWYKWPARKTESKYSGTVDVYITHCPTSQKGCVCLKVYKASRYSVLYLHSAAGNDLVAVPEPRDLRPGERADIRRV